MITGLHHVQLAAPAGSEPRLRDFYSGLLGLAEVPKPADLARRGGVWFRGPAVELHLGIEDDFRPARKAHPGLLADDLPGLVARLREAGIEARPDGLLPGFQRCYVDDPVGNRIELLQPADHS
jgi:catechol 2,3-dioxygenase-like lactoylglutathione lyase family enzyme